MKYNNIIFEFKGYGLYLIEFIKDKNYRIRYHNRMDNTVCNGFISTDDLEFSFRKKDWIPIRIKNKHSFCKGCKREFIL